MTETSGHLPECLTDDDIYGLRGLCICDELRACEQRVRQSAATLWDRTSEQMAAARVEGIRAGMDAARKAVVALKPWLKVEKYKGGYDCCGCSTTYDLMRDALAAIDALREEKG